jgi:amino-acid N-acetyltransferase
MTTDQENSFPLEWLRQTSPYINTHRQKTFVVWLSDELLDRDSLKHVVHDLTLLSHLGVRLVLVHGMRSQIDRALAENNIGAEFASPRETSDDAQLMRITTSQMLPTLHSLLGRLRCRIESLFSTGLPNTPMSGARVTICSGNFVVARPYGVRQGVDYHHTGEIRKIRVNAIRHLLDLDMIVLLQPAGYSPTGEFFNLHAEDVATRTAMDLNAEKLIFLHHQTDDLATALGGIREISVTVHGFQHALPAALSNIKSIVQNAALACRRGVRRCHIVSSLHDGALLKELFTRDGSGLLIDAGHYDSLRPANTRDVAGIKALIQPLIDEGILVDRSEQDLERCIGDFYVAEREGSVIGCASLTRYDTQAEVGCLAVHPDFRASGKAAEIVQFLIKEARTQGCRQLFAMSTRSGDWFREQGFVPGDNSAVPEDKNRIASDRGSKVYLYDLIAPAG